MSHWEENLMRVRVEREVNVKLGVVLNQVVVQCDSLTLCERFGSSIDIRAWSSWRSLIASLIFHEPVEGKVAVWIDTPANEWNWWSGLAPVPVELARVFVATMSLKLNLVMDLIKHRTHPSGFAKGTMYQSTFSEMNWISGSSDRSNSFSVKVAVAEAIHSRAWMFASMKIARLFCDNESEQVSDCDAIET